MPANTPASKISAADLEKAAQLGQGLYVVWCGAEYRSRVGSGRAASLATITEVFKPVPFADYLRRAAVAKGTTGWKPVHAHQGAFLHRGTNGAVYFVVEKTDTGEYLVAADYPIPHESVSKKALRVGDRFPVALGGSPKAKPVAKPAAKPAGAKPAKGKPAAKAAAAKATGAK